MAIFTAMAIGAAVGGGLGWLATGEPEGAAIGAAGGGVTAGVGGGLAAAGTGAVASTIAGAAAGAATTTGLSALSKPKVPGGSPIQGAATPGAVQAQAPAAPTGPHNVPPGFPMPMPGMVPKRSSRGMAPTR